MDDIISKYKKQKKIRTISIITASFLLAISFNVYLSTSELWKTLKTSVIENSWSQNSQSDLYLDSGNNMVNMKSGKNMSWVKNISFSFIYNWDNVEFKDTLLWKYEASIQKLTDTKWQYTLNLEFKTPTDIKAWEDILKIVVEKNSTLTENINLVQANFTDSENNSFSLTTSWVQY